MNKKELISLKLGEFISTSLKNGRNDALNNHKELINPEDAINELEFIKNYYSINNKFNGHIKHPQMYNNLYDKCKGNINYSDVDIENIKNLIEESLILFGDEDVEPFFDIISFSVKYLDKLENLYINKLESNKKKLGEIIKYKELLKLTTMPLYYEPYSCIILMNKPLYQLKILNHNNETICNIDNNGILTIDNIKEQEKINEESMDDAVSCAVSWWTKALTNPVFAIRSDENISFLGKVAALYYQMGNYSYDNSKIDKFEKILEEKIIKELKDNNKVVIETNRNMDSILKTSLHEAKLDELTYDFNTKMTITKDKVELMYNESSSKNILYEKKKVKVLTK